MNYHSVSIIILNWNGWKDTIECLKSLYKINYPKYDIIVVDNGSEDDSIEIIRKFCEGKIEIKSEFFDYDKENKPIKIFEYFENDLIRFKQDYNQFKELNPGKRVILIKNRDNKGYAEGNNVGIRFVLKYLNSDYTLILNNDVVVDPDFLTELVIAAESKPNIGIIGPVNLNYYDPEYVDSMGAKVNFWIGSWKPLKMDEYSIKNNNNYIDVDFVLGAAFMIKRDVIKKIGVFYSNYFANWEETDYCIQAKNNGFNVISVPKSKIWHKISSSISITNPNRIYWILRNNILFMRRNAKFRYFPSFLFFYFFFRVPSFIYWGFRCNSFHDLFKLIRMITKAVKEGLTLKI